MVELLKEYEVKIDFVKFEVSIAHQNYEKAMALGYGNSNAAEQYDAWFPIWKCIDEFILAERAEKSHALPWP